MGSQLETVELRIAHVVLVVADNALLDLHPFRIRRFIGGLSLSVVAFFTGKIFLVFPMREPGCFFTGRTLQFHVFRTGITCHPEAAAGQ